MPYTIITGGVRSGKSRCAERLAGLERNVLYVATGKAWDPEMAERIERHQCRRPAQWGLLETEVSLLESLKNQQSDEQKQWDCILIDCISNWISRILLNLPEVELHSDKTRRSILHEAELLSDWLETEINEAVIVTNEVGFGGVAMTSLGRAFQDLLGEVNQILSMKAKDIYIVISGRALRLPEIE